MSLPFSPNHTKGTNMTAQGRRLLELVLEKLIKVVPAERLDMGSYFQDREEKTGIDSKDVRYVTVPFAEENCGTAGCVLGWGTTIPEWKAAGFVRLGDNLTPRLVDQNGNEVASGYEAARRLLGLSYGEAHYLFNPNSYQLNEDGGTDRNDVIERLENFLVNTSTEPQVVSPYTYTSQGF